ncbi:MAG: C4-dicarboxylate ABC transporter permease, partial [Desulfohalobiaceae bacterium]
MSAVETGLLGVFLVFFLILLRMPVAYVMLVVGFAGYAFMTSTNAALSIAASTMYNTFASYSLIVVPL